MNPLVLILAVCVLLAIQYRLAARFGRITRVLVSAQSAYWFLAFVARPTYLWLMRPDTLNPLADSRLAATNYGLGLVHVLQLVLIGLAATDVTLLLCRPARSLAERSIDARILSTRSEMLGAVSLICAGWLGRIAQFAGVGALGRILDPLEIVGMGMVIASAASNRLRFRVYALLGVGELAWSLYSHSKTPVFSYFIALIVGWAAAHARHLGRRIAALGIVALAAFLAIQPLKGVTTARNPRAYYSGQAAPVVGGVTELLQRTDLVAAVTDAWAYSPKPWLSLGSYARYAAELALPLGPKTVDPGLRWAQEVRSRSEPIYASISVSLATGPIAEGDVQWGVIGIVVESILVELAAIAIGERLIAGKIVWLAFMATFAFNTVLFEQGILGLAATTAKALEAVAVFNCGRLMLGRNVESTDLARSMPSRFAAKHDLGTRVSRYGVTYIHRGDEFAD